MGSPVGSLRFLVLVTALAPSSRAQELDSVMEPRVHASEKHGNMPYRFFKRSADKDTARHPLVLFLHGAGERGDDNRAQLRHGVREFISAKSQAARPCFVAAPQCPSGVWWMDEKRQALLLDLVATLVKSERIDPERIYVTGLSMGGYGTWFLLAAAPDLFAAAVPICGGGEIAKASRIKTPVWAFHGGADRVVIPQKSREMVEALKKSGQSPKYTEYEGVNHNSWTRTYKNADVHAWLFSHRRPRSDTPKDQPDPREEDDPLELTADTLSSWKAKILPEPAEVAFEAVPWKQSFQEGTSEAAATGRPLLLWAMNGHPLGCT